MKLTHNSRAVRVELFTARVLYRVSYRVLEYRLIIQQEEGED